MEFSLLWGERGKGKGKGKGRKAAAAPALRDFGSWRAPPALGFWRSSHPKDRTYETRRDRVREDCVECAFFRAPSPTSWNLPH